MDTKKTGNILLFCLLIIVLLFLINISSLFLFNQISSTSPDVSQGGDSEGCNVLGLTLHGDMVTFPDAATPAPDGSAPFASTYPTVSSDTIVFNITQADADQNIKAILLEIDSGGGLPVAGEEIANALKNSSKPTIALIRQSGLSAAYWAATGADRIFASRNSDVGSIGVTGSYLDNSEKDKLEGVTYIELISGKYKDAGNPDRKITEEEKALYKRDLDIIHENFIQDVSKNRNLPIDNVRKIADGSSVLGENARALGLIDDIGSWKEADAYISNIIGEPTSMCWQ